VTARGVVAAGHPETARAGADVLRAGGNAVDAAVGAVLASLAAEPLLTGLGAGGYMLVALPGAEPRVLDFFVEAPGRGADAQAREELVPISVSFGDAIQVFNVGPASVGTYGVPAGLADAAARFGSLPLAELAAPAVALARGGVEVNAVQAYVIEILGEIATSTPESAALFAPGGRLLREGDTFHNPDLAAALELLGRDGAAPFYTGEVAAAVIEWLDGRGAMLTATDLAAYRVVDRDPVRVAYRGRDVVTTPPPSAGGTLIAYALALLERSSEPLTPARLVDVMAAAQAERTPEFLDGLDDEGFLDRFLASRLGSTTHVSVLDAGGGACGVTCSNGEGSGIVVPGTGLHLNNMLGEQDLNPLGFHRHPAGRRMPSMMSPTMVLGEAGPELVLGSGGSNRIRSAIIQAIVNVLDHEMDVAAAVRAPRLHFEDGIVYAEPGVEVDELGRGEEALARFRELNLFFGGVHAVARDPVTGELSGGGDPRRGGSVAVA
jgi:gamma-glutamyltranspeptidase/glutathione hydrolase